MNEFKRMIIKVSDATNDVATIPTTNDHTDGSWLATDIYIGELFLNIADDILQTRTDAGIVTLNTEATGGAWGDISGTLSNQIDLQNALDLKVNNSDYTPSHSLLVQQSGTGSPTSLSVGNNTLVGRQSGGGSQIDDLSVSDVKTMLSIDNVDNTSDLNKPVSTAQQTEIDTKQDTLISGQNIKTINGGTILGSGDISLDNNFISLNDAPESYTGSGGYAVQVNAGETGLEFVASGGGGGGSLLVQSLDTIDLTTNQWYIAQNSDNWLSGSLTSPAGTNAEPNVILKNSFFVKDKESLNDFYLSFYASSGGNYEIYLASYDFSTGFFPPNKQILVNETFSAMGGAPFLKTDFNIATNTLSADSILFVSIRAIDGNDTLSGLTMNYGFQA